MRKFTRSAFLVVAGLAVFAASSAATINIRTDSDQVDGINDNARVAVKTAGGARAPVFSWEIDGSEVVTLFVIGVSTASDFSVFVWNITGSTTAENTTRFADFDLIKTAYAGTEPLVENSTYYWGVQVYGDRGSTATVTGVFSTISLIEKPGAATIDLKIDYNNPLKPGKVTRLVAAAFDRDRPLKMRVFSITGELVMDWPVFIVPKNAYYVIEWDGRGADGKFPPRGIYIVNLYDENDKARVNRRIAILDR